MPNHMHGILILGEIEIPSAGSSFVETLHCNVSTNDDNGNNNDKNQFMSSLSPKPGSVSTIIRSYKSACTKHMNQLQPELNFKWQERFYDHIIRSDDDFKRIANYIVNNPKNWVEDRFFNQE